MRQEEILSENELSEPKIRNNRTDGINIKACEAVRFLQDKRGEETKMNEFETEVEKAKKELEEGLIPVEKTDLNDEFLGDIKMQAQEYGQKFQDAADKARDFASEKFTQAGEKIKELQNKDPRELVEDAKEYARQKPGQTILISAAIGLALGFLLRRK
jgi:ElaB/YqjD/DUF883 family membrane-anchored ribosome-binding protein